MANRRTVLGIVTASALLGPFQTYAQSPAEPSEGAVRDAIRQYLAAWNRHDAAAWGDFLTADVHYVFPNSNNKHTRETVTAYGAGRVRDFELKLELVRLQLQQNGRQAAAVLRGQYLELPQRDGRYARVWERDPMLTRWRVDGGKWRAYYINEVGFESAALVKAEGLD